MADSAADGRRLLERPAFDRSLVSDVFSHAVASFDPTAEAVLLWTRLARGTSTQWVLARDPALTDVVTTGEAATDLTRDGTVVVDATGLEPATTYWFRFTADGQDSPIGRTRTLPGGGTGEFVLGLVSCANYSVAPLTVYRALAQREVDLVVHMGDYVYDSGGKPGRREHQPPGRVISLADYRIRLGQMRSDPDCQALHLRHPMAAVVDDHDLADNAWRGGAKTHNESTDGLWTARALAAMTARSEWLPTRRRDPDEVKVTWRSFAVDGLVELVLLDSRLHGRDQQAGEDGALPIEAPTRTILGPDQRAWALERIADPTCPWVLVANGVVVNEIVLRPPFARLVAPLMPEGYFEYDGKLLRDDQWDGYPAERRRLVAAVAGRKAEGGGTVLLSGDVHSSWAFHGPCDEDGQPVAVEVVTPSVSSAPMGRTRLPVMWRLLDAMLRRLDHVRFVDVTNRGFVLLHVTPERVAAGWYWVDPYDPKYTPDVEAARWLAVERSDVRPTWYDTEPPAPPVRAGQDLAIPPRPPDVRAARRHHQRRRAAGLVVVVVAAAAVAGTSIRLFRRWRQ